jgi:hypothetical protein
MRGKIYNPTMRIVVSYNGARVIFLVNLDAIFYMLLFLENQTPLDEESLVTKFNSLTLAQKGNLLVKFLLVGENIHEIIMPFQASTFSDLSQEIIFMTCLVLGYENTIDESILGFINKIAHAIFFNYSKYLFDAIHNQLVHFSSLKCFKYQSYLIYLMLYF